MTGSVIDEAVFAEIRDVLDEALIPFIQTYLENSPKLLKQMRQSLQQGDLESLYLDAHQLKGGSGSIGAMQVFQLSKEIEQAARLGEPAGLVALLEQLQAAYQSVQQELEAYI